VQWAKFLLNLNNPINALSNLPLRDELSQRAYRRCLAAAQSETLGLLDAEGIQPAKLLPVPMHRFPAILGLPDFLFRRLAGTMLAIDPLARTSMWRTSKPAGPPRSTTSTVRSSASPTPSAVPPRSTASSSTCSARPGPTAAPGRARSYSASFRGSDATAPHRDLLSHYVSHFFSYNDHMNAYDVAVIGGSVAGLQAALTLGRARRRPAGAFGGSGTPARSPEQ